MSPRVALVIVSHSDLLARGIVEVAGQMAPDVTLVAAGGTDDRSLGTSYDRIERAVAEALGAAGGDDAPPGGGVVVLTDLGSATMTVESVLEMADDHRVVFADAPLVEGAVAAAVRAQLGDAVAQVAAAARDAAAAFRAPEAGGGPGLPSALPVHDGIPVIRATAPPDPGESATGEATVGDPVGLHARPAALLARLAGTFDAETTVDGAAADSVLELMALGVRQGDVVHLRATGPQAADAVRALTAMLEDGGGPAVEIDADRP